MTRTQSSPDLSPIVELRLHLGAHKTATTHLQDMLAASRDTLLGQGVDYLPLQPLRDAAAPLFRRGRWWRRGALLRRAWAEALSPLRRGPGVLVLSEENFLGGVEGPLLSAPYAQARARLRPLSALTAGASRTTAFFAIRSFDEVLASSYAQTLRHQAWGESFDDIRKRAVAAPPSWLPVLHAIAGALPGADLRVWRYDDYPAHGAAIRAALCGVPDLPTPDLPRPARTRTPGQDAIAKAAALPASVKGRARLDRVGAIYAASADAQAPRWAPFGAEERLALRAQYDADLGLIERDFPGALMRFGDLPA